MMFLGEESQIRDYIVREFQKDFDTKLVDIKERTRLVADLYKYRLEDEYFWKQSKGKIPRHYSLYFDDEFVCGFDSTYPPEAIKLVWWRGLKKLVEEGRVHFDKRMKEVDEAVEKYKKNLEKEDKKKKLKKKIEAIKNSSEESELAYHVINSLENDKAN